MYTLDTKKQQHLWKKTALCYLGISVFCVMFTIIYESFSYGESSTTMRLMFLFPLIGGTLPSLFFSFKPLKYQPSRRSYNLWNSGIAILTNGCVIKGIINISGRFTDYDRIYWGLGICFLLASVLFYFIDVGKLVKAR